MSPVSVKVSRWESYSEASKEICSFSKSTTPRKFTCM